MVLITVVTGEGLGFLGGIHKLLHLICRANLHLHIRLVASLLCTLMEHVTDMFRLHIHLQGILALVHHNLRGIAFFHHRLEVGIGGLTGDTAVLRTATGEIEQDEGEERNAVDPVHIESWHIHLRSVIAFVREILIVHISLN